MAWEGFMMVAARRQEGQAPRPRIEGTLMGRLFRVTGIRTVASASETHDHVAAVRQGTNPQLISRALVVADLRDPIGDRYYVETREHRADLAVAACPICSFDDYLRTSVDNTTADLLLSLPRV
jgi:hypothetical protein